MGHRGRRTIAAGLTLLLWASALPAQAADPPLIPDPGLRACLTAAVGGEPTAENLAALTTVYCAATHEVTDLTGIEALTSLKNVYFASDVALDLSRLPALPALWGVSLDLPATVDLTPLASLPQLLGLYLTVSAEHDLSPLAGLPLTSLFLGTGDTTLPALPALGGPLEHLSVVGRALTSVDGLERVAAQTASFDVPVLTDSSAFADMAIGSLRLTTPQSGISDSLAQTRGLSALTLFHSEVTDLTPLGGAPELATLRITDPRNLTDLGPAGGLRGLEVLSAPGSQVTSVAALQGADRLSELDLSGARIGDISALADLPDGASVNLTGNRIHDFSPLAGWRGTLKALEQKVTLPAVIEDTPFPIRLLDESGKPLLGLDEDEYRDGQLRYLYSSTRASLYLMNAFDSATITVSLYQEVKPGRTFRNVSRLVFSTSRPKVGKRVSVSLAPWTPQPTSVTYRWLRDGQEIPGATGSSYVPTAADRGSLLWVVARGRREGYHPEYTRPSLSDYPVAKGSFSSVSTPSIKGRRAVGSKLTATVTWQPNPTKLSYQWYRNGRKISGATKASYTLKASDHRDRFTVKVTARRAGYHTLTKSSASTGRVAKGTLTTAKVSINGDPTVGTRLTAHRGTWGPGTVSYSYRWYRDGEKIRGATARTYTATKADRGHRLTVKVTGRKTGYTTRSVTSAAVRIA